MGLFEQFPYLNLHQLNLDWVLDQVKKCVAGYAQISDDFNDLKEYVNNYFETLDVPEAVQSYIDSLIESGRMDEIIERAVNVYLTPEMYGAAGDGTTNDYNAFAEMFADAITKKAMVIIPNKRYKLSGADDLALSSLIIGKGAVIEYSGFKFIAGGTLNISNLEFISNAGESCISFTDSGKELIASNLKFVNTGDRSGVALRASAEVVNINNVYAEKFARAVVFNNTANIPSNSDIVIEFVTAVNCQTGVDIEGTYTQSLAEHVNNVEIHHVKLINTAAQKAEMITEIGSDAVLVGGCHNLKISDVYSTYARERTVYVNNARDVQISNVVAIGSQAVKVAGTNLAGYTPIFSENIAISDIVARDVGSNGYLLTLYDVKNVTASDIKEINTTTTGNDSVPAIELTRTCENVVISDVYLENLARGAVYLHPTSNALANTLKNITISDMIAVNPSFRVSYDVIRVDSGGQDYIDGLKLININVNPGTNYYVNGNLYGFITLNSMKNVVIENCDIRGCAALTGSIIKPVDISQKNIRVNGYTQFIAATMAHGYDISQFADNSNITCVNYGGSADYNFAAEAKLRKSDVMVKEVVDIDIKLPYQRAIVPTGTPAIVSVIGPACQTFNWTGAAATTIVGSGLALSGYGILTGPAGNYKVTLIF